MFNNKYWEQRERGFQGIQFEPLWWSGSEPRTYITNVIKSRDYITKSFQVAIMPVYCEWILWLYSLESDLPKLTFPSGVHNCILLGCNTLHYLGVPIYTFWVFKCMQHKSVESTLVHSSKVLRIWLYIVRVLRVHPYSLSTLVQLCTSEIVMHRLSMIWSWLCALIFPGRVITKYI